MERKEKQLETQSTGKSSYKETAEKQRPERHDRKKDEDNS